MSQRAESEERSTSLPQPGFEKGSKFETSCLTSIHVLRQRSQQSFKGFEDSNSLFVGEMVWRALKDEAVEIDAVGVTGDLEEPRKVGDEDLRMDWEGKLAGCKVNVPYAGKGRRTESRGAVLAVKCHDKGG